MYPSTLTPPSKRIATVMHCFRVLDVRVHLFPVRNVMSVRPDQNSDLTKKRLKSVSHRIERTCNRQQTEDCCLFKSVVGRDVPLEVVCLLVFYCQLFDWHSAVGAFPYICTLCVVLISSLQHETWPLDLFCAETITMAVAHKKKGSAMYRTTCVSDLFYITEFGPSGRYRLSWIEHFAQWMSNNLRAQRKTWNLEPNTLLIVKDKLTLKLCLLKKSKRMN